MNYLIPLKIEHLTVAYHKQPVLFDVNIEIASGGLVGILGPNGAGKSSLIKAVMGLIPTISGTIKVFGKPFNKELKRIGYVPQRESVDWDFPVNVFDVVMMGRYSHIGLFKRPSQADKDCVYAALEKVHLLPFAKRQISELSGGQQQRVFLARALAQDSDLYFLDEPFAGVDAATEHAIVEVLSQLREQGKTLLVIHHDLASAQHYFDQVVLLNKQVIASGPIDAVFTLENLQKTYEGKLNVFSHKHRLFIAQENEPEEPQA